MHKTDWTPNGVWGTYLEHFNVLEQGKRDFERSANDFLTALGKRVDEMSWNKEPVLKFKEIPPDSWADKSYVEYYRSSHKMSVTAKAGKGKPRQHSLVVRVGFLQLPGRPKGEFYTHVRYAAENFTRREREIIERFCKRQQDNGERQVALDQERAMGDGFYFRFVEAADVGTLMDRAFGALEATHSAVRNLLSELGA